MFDNVLLIGGSGQLGSCLKKQDKFINLNSPSKKELDLRKKKSIGLTLKKYAPKIIINCAAITDMKFAEKYPGRCFETNVIGTINLVNEIKKYNKSIKLIHLSSDGVYASTKGNYSEKSRIEPYNLYCWSKYLSEIPVKKLKKFVIIRTRFFDKNKIKFKKIAKDIYTSSIEINDLSKKILKLLKNNFSGIINIGTKRMSLYNRYKKYKKIVPISRSKILANLDIQLAKDSSMNIKKMQKFL
jgi:dTDP-4-dehydrorhamnose reductase